MSLFGFGNTGLSELGNDIFEEFFCRIDIIPFLYIFDKISQWIHLDLEVSLMEGLKICSIF